MYSLMLHLKKYQASPKKLLKIHAANRINKITSRNILSDRVQSGFERSSGVT